MAKLLFGLSGDGRGHGSRDKVIIEHLLEQGHEVKVVTSGKGYEFLRDYFGVEPILGLRVVNRNEQVDAWQTVKEASRLLTVQGWTTAKTLISIINRFKPDIAISDFEPFTSFMSHISRIPLISIDNQHVITRCKLEYLNTWEKEYRIAYAVCGGINGFAKHYFITCFFSPEVKRMCRRNTSMVGPILRKEVLEKRPETGNHVLVYMRTPERGEAVLPLLEQVDAEFIAYGVNTTDISSKNICIKSPDNEVFLNDLASSKAVITNGGHSLISEALYLGKPVYSIPTHGDFEQMINAYYLQRLNYGLYDLHPSVKRIRFFLNFIEHFKENIDQDHSRFNSNDQFFSLIDSTIESICNTSRVPAHLFSADRPRTTNHSKRFYAHLFSPTGKFVHNMQDLCARLTRGNARTAPSLHGISGMSQVVHLWRKDIRRPCISIPVMEVKKSCRVFFGSIFSFLVEEVAARVWRRFSYHRL
jgi:uncharacterized protein (TIGR00661 family)